MYKIKRMFLIVLELSYIILSIIELVKYLFVNTTTFGVIYLLICLFIIFLLVPVVHNYNKYYSLARISKLILIIILGIFSSFFLSKIMLSNLNYIDSSKNYISNIFIIKNILKPIIYFSLAIFTIFEFKLDNILKHK